MVERRTETMIELKVDEYCHDCPEFVPESDKLFRSRTSCSVVTTESLRPIRLCSA